MLNRPTKLIRTLEEPEFRRGGVYILLIFGMLREEDVHHLFMKEIMMFLFHLSQILLQMRMYSLQNLWDSRGFWDKSCRLHIIIIKQRRRWQQSIYRLR